MSLPSDFSSRPNGAPAAGDSSKEACWIWPESGIRCLQFHSALREQIGSPLVAHDLTDRYSACWSSALSFRIL